MIPRLLSVRRPLGGSRLRLLELLFPPACVACGEALVDGGPAAYCTACIEEFSEFTPPCCGGCGRSIPYLLPTGKTCGHCGGERTRYERAITLGPYEHLLREQLLRAKKPHGELSAIALAHRMVEVHGDALRQSAFDVVCPVPMHWWRRLRRMTNSPGTMANVFAQELDVPLASGLLARRRNTLPQFTLSNTERAKNVRNAFALAGGYRLSGANVLLVDDILTTGSTVTEATRALLAGGADRVTVVAIARSSAEDSHSAQVPRLPAEEMSGQ